MPPIIHHDADLTAHRQRLYRELKSSTRQLWPSYVADLLRPGSALDAHMLRSSGGFRQLDPSRSEAEMAEEYTYLTETLKTHDATFEWARDAFEQAHGSRAQCQTIGEVMLRAGMQVDGTTDKDRAMDGKYSCKELGRWLTMDDEPRANFKALREPAADSKVRGKAR